MELTPPSNTAITTRQDVEHATETLRSKMSRHAVSDCSSRLPLPSGDGGVDRVTPLCTPAQKRVNQHL